MIAALILALLGLWLALALPGSTSAAALLVIPPAIWLMRGGGQRLYDHTRREGRGGDEGER